MEADSFRSPPSPREPAGAEQQPVPGKLGELLIWTALVGAVGFLLFLRYYLATLAAGGKAYFLAPLIQEMTGALGAGLLFFPVRRFVRARPLGRRTWKRRWPLYLLAMLLFSAVHTTLNWGLRIAVFRLVGLGAYDYGIMPLRYAMELPGDVVVFWIMVTALQVADRLRAARARELETARLESSLARAELSNLRLQLQPHFLFNTLNTISSTMYDDPTAADEMLDRLAELLRASLRTARTDEVPFNTELETVDCYLAILKARFGDRLRVDFDLDEGIHDALVPSMLLQPILENAVRHGNVEKEGHGHVVIRGRVAGGSRLRLEIEDDGPGRPEDDDEPSTGVGLSATAERLQLLYGDAGHFEAGNAPGGFRVAIVVPLRRQGDEG